MTFFLLLENAVPRTLKSGIMLHYSNPKQANSSREAPVQGSVVLSAGCKQIAVLWLWIGGLEPRNVVNSEKTEARLS